MKIVNKKIYYSLGFVLSFIAFYLLFGLKKEPTVMLLFRSCCLTIAVTVSVLYLSRKNKMPFIVKIGLYLLVLVLLSLSMMDLLRL